VFHWGFRLLVIVCAADQGTSQCPFLWGSGYHHSCCGQGESHTQPTWGAWRVPPVGYVGCIILSHFYWTNYSHACSLMWVWPCSKTLHNYIMPVVTLSHVWYRKRSTLIRDGVDKCNGLIINWEHLWLIIAWESYQQKGWAKIKFFENWVRPLYFSALQLAMYQSIRNSSSCFQKMHLYRKLVSKRCICTGSYANLFALVT